jgi:hypothetical protein
MADAAVTIFGLPAALVAAGVAGSLGILGSVASAVISKRKSSPEPMPSLTFGYAYPPNGPSSPRMATRRLRQLSITLVVAAVLSFGAFVYGQAAGGTGDPPAEVPLVPQQARAIAVTESVANSCSPQKITYTADNLIDGKHETAWWASSGDDGVGKFAIITFASTVHLTTVGLIPGYANQRPREDQDCKISDAFPSNRNIESVRYDFDDGQSIIQHFEPESRIQTRPVNTTTTNVRITILSTRLPPGADNDTLISETYFVGKAIG